MAYNFESYNSEAAYQATIVTQKNLYVGGTTTLVGATSLSGNLTLGAAVGSATVSGGSVTVNTQKGIITTASLTTGSYVIAYFDLKNSLLTTDSHVYLSLFNGSNSLGTPVPQGAVCKTAGSATVAIANAGSVSLNGTVRINFLVV